MTSLLERAARAANEVLGGEPANMPISTAIVRAVLGAVREPTDEMLEAAIAPYRHANTEEFTKIYKETVAGYMRAMIDCILSQEPK